MSPTLTFWGAAREVTGSCYEVDTGRTRFLVDCGMHQGGQEESARNVQPFPFDPAAIDFMLLTHAHIDHCGLIPRLVRQGFAGPIFATAATADLATILMRDSGHIQEMEAEWRGRKGRRAGRERLWQPAYTEEDARRAAGSLQSCEYEEELTPAPGVRVRFRDAGHILGSAILEVGLDRLSTPVPAPPETTTRAPGTVRVIFSGDVGQPDQPIIRDPETGMAGDYVVMESTYGDRRHEAGGDAVAELGAILRAAKQSGGNVIIPAFAVGRTQEIIYFLRTLCEEQGVEMPIYVDSPLARAATDIYRRHTKDFDEEARALIDGNHSIFRFSQLRYTESADESRRLNEMRGIVIISASGMADAGRIKHHLKHNLWRPEAHVVFVGYQAPGTMGRRLVEGEKMVRIFGEEIAVKARIHEMSGLSAHADREQLITWASLLPKPRLLFLTHGEPQAAFSLEQALKERLGLAVQVPTRGEVVQLGR